MKYAIGVDIGGTNSRAALVDEHLNMVQRVQFPTDAEDPNATFDRLAEVVKELSGDKEVVGIGISCPGPLDLIHGNILETPNLHGEWTGFEVVKTLREKTGLPAWLENDANLAALAEAVAGEGKDYRYVQFLTISTGLGSGQVIDRQIYIGAHGFAHEVANVCMWRNGPQYNALYPGGIEAISSGTAITKRANDAGLKAAHAGEVNDLAKAGNPIAQEIMDDAKEYLANFIAGLIAVTDPEIVILGGSVALKIDGFTEDVEARVKEKVFPVVRPYVKVRKSTLSEDSGLLGAACLAFEKTK
jgi:glucokinase